MELALRPAKLDRGDSDEVRDWIAGHDAEGVIPSERNRKTPIPHDREACKRRHKVENLFCRTKDVARITPRTCETSRSYAGFVSLAFALINVQSCQ